MMELERSKLGLTPLVKILHEQVHKRNESIHDPANKDHSFLCRRVDAAARGASLLQEHQ